MEVSVALYVRFLKYPTLPRQRFDTLEAKQLITRRTKRNFYHVHQPNRNPIWKRICQSHKSMALHPLERPLLTLALTTHATIPLPMLPLSPGRNFKPCKSLQPVIYVHSLNSHRVQRARISPWIALYRLLLAYLGGDD